MEEGITPLLWSNIAKYGAISSSFESARQTLVDWGVNISLKLQVFAENFYSKEEERKKWFKQARSALKKGEINFIIQDMTKLSFNLVGERRKNLDREINYFIKGNKEGRFNYHKVSKMKLPIGSGAVESLIRQAVNLRMKGNSKFWLKNNAEIILHARCQWIAGCWNNFCNSILTAFVKPIQIA